MALTSGIVIDHGVAKVLSFWCCDAMLFFLTQPWRGNVRKYDGSRREQQVLFETWLMHPRGEKLCRDLRGDNGLDRFVDCQGCVHAIVRCTDFDFISHPGALPSVCHRLRYQYCFVRRHKRLDEILFAYIDGMFILDDPIYLPRMCGNIFGGGSDVFMLPMNFDHTSDCFQTSVIDARGFKCKLNEVLTRWTAFDCRVTATDNMRRSRYFGLQIPVPILWLLLNRVWSTVVIADGKFYQQRLPLTVQHAIGQSNITIPTIPKEDNCLNLAVIQSISKAQLIISEAKLTATTTLVRQNTMFLHGWITCIWQQVQDLVWIK